MSHLLANFQEYLAAGKVVNYIQGVEIKLTKFRGRGVFATKDLERGELIVVEKALAEAR